MPYKDYTKGGIMGKQIVQPWKPRSLGIGKGAAATMLGVARLKQSRDIATERLMQGEERLEVSRERNKILRTSKERLKPENYISMFNAYNRSIDATNKARRANIEDEVPRLGWSQWLMQEHGITPEELMPNYIRNKRSQAGANQLLNGPIMNQNANLSGIIDQARNMAIQNIPAANRGPLAQPRMPDRATLDRLVGSIPNPQPIVSDKLPKLNQLMSMLDTYDDAETALQDLVDTDDQLMEYGLDLADVPGINSFVQAFGSKFGMEYANQLMQQAMTKRGNKG